MVDTTKFKNYHHQSNELVALEWLIDPLNEQFDRVHSERVLCQDIAKVYRHIVGALTMANLPDAAALARLIHTMAQHPSHQTPSDKYELMSASYLLCYELNHYVRTGFLHNALLGLKTAYLSYLLGASLPDDFCAFSEKIPPTTCHQSNQINAPNIAHLWQEWLAKLQNQSPQSDPFASADEMSALKQAVATLCATSVHQLLHKLWALVALWLDNAPNQQQKLVSAGLFDKLHQAFLLSQDDPDASTIFWLENLLADVYVMLATLKCPDNTTQEFLESLEDNHLIEQDFFVYMAVELQTIDLTDKQQAAHRLQALKKHLLLRGWEKYASWLDDAMWQLDKDEAPNLTGLYQEIQALSELLHDDVSVDENASTLSKTYQALQTAKQQFSDYLRSKDVDDLPKADDFWQPQQAFDDSLPQVSEVCEQLALVFDALCDKAPKRVSWQLAHQLADGLLFFELFLDELTKQRFDRLALQQAKQHIKAALSLVVALVDEVDEIFDIYAKLLTAHQHTTLYDDDGCHEPVMGEVIGSDLSKQNGDYDDEHIEEALVSDIILPKKSPLPVGSVIKPAGHAQSLAPFINDEYKSKDIFLTDILSIPNITLSHQDNHNDIKAMAAYAMMGDSVVEDLTPIERLLKPSANAQYYAVKSAAKFVKAAKPLSVYKEFIEETNQVNDNNTAAPSQQPQAAVQTHGAAYLALKATLKDDDFGFDEEFREIFIEEVDEVLEQLREVLPSWQSNITDNEMLTQIRRHFHTLKGSGRMVGAFCLGETAWAIENLLNRVLDTTIKVSEDIAALVAKVVDVIPIMVQDFAQKQPPSVDNVGFILQADNLLAGRPIGDGLIGDAPPSSSESGEQSPKNSTQPSDVTADLAHDEMLLPEVLTPFMEAASQPVPSLFPDADADIRAIFVEDAQEVLAQIIPKFGAWQKDRSQHQLLLDIRCGFHALKGSGRMVGAAELGELSWAIENLLNRVLDESLVLNDGMVLLLSDVLADFGHLLTVFRDGLCAYPEHVILWIACAHAYSQGHGDEFDYRIFSHFAQNHGMDWSLDKQSEPQETNNAPAEAPCQSAQSLGFIQEAKDIILNATPTTPDDEEEILLCQIFVEEGKELLTEVKAFLHSNQSKDSVPVNDRIVRAFHTLRGASGLPPLALVAEVGAIIEHGLQNLQQHDAPMKRSHLQALGHAVELIEAHLLAYEDAGTDETIKENPDFSEDKHALESLLKSSQDDMSDIAVLIEGIDGLLDAELELGELTQKPPAAVAEYANKQSQEIGLLLTRTHEFPKFQMVLDALAQAYQLLACHPDCLDECLAQTLMAVHRELVGLFDSLAGSMSLKVDEVALEQLSAWCGECLTNLNAQTAAKTTDAAATTKKRKTVLVEELAFEDITTDDELLDIFLTEAQDIIGRSANNFKAWCHELDNAELSTTLQRDLYSLAGGSSLAGVMSIYQMAQAAEMVFESLKDEQITINDEWLSILQQAYDVLALQVDFIKNRKQSFFVCHAVEDLHRYLAAGTLDKGATIRTPVIEVEIDTAEDEPDLLTEEASTNVSSPIDVQQFIKDSWHGVLPDKDILNIFLEEAKELAESSSEDFATFRHNTADKEVLQSLQRKLHTIKGGARMVPVNGIADLAHEMETIYEDLGNHRYFANQSVVNLLFACHDWIVAALNLLKSHYNPPRPTLLIDALHQFIQNPDSVVAVPLVSLSSEAQVIAQYQSADNPVAQTHDISQMPPMQGMFAQKTKQHTSAEMIRIAVPVMEDMINLSGETAINRARIDMSIVGLTASIEEMGVTVQRLADQLRRMDIELETQILSQIDEMDKLDAGFDPLEMDRYSSLNQLSKSLSESASDLLDIKTTLLDKTRNSESLLLQLSRIQTELQDKLMGSRMVPFSRLTPRLHRIVRQTANELGKIVELTVINADGEVDRTILEHITAPLEHMLRNAIDHGIEFPERRSELGKSTTGQIKLQMRREGNELVLLLSDDGAGIDVNGVRQKILAQGLIRPEEQLSDNDVIQYIFNAGLSTAGKVTQISGRGVGMDVVRTEIRQLGGSVSVESTMGQGSCFIMRVPLVVALSDVLVVRVADHQYAIPLVQIERVIQVDATKMLAHYQSGEVNIDLEGQEYRLRYLNEILSNCQFSEDGLDSSAPVIIAKSQVGYFALQVDEIVGSRMEVVAKPLGNQLSRLSGISAATIMGDGSVMLILDLPALMRTPQQLHAKEEPSDQVQRHLIMVIDDSVTVRKVTSRFLERQGFDVVVAKDGVHAIEILQDTVPDLMLLDIEMPRMDGFEVATQVRHSQRLKDVPIIMITSRTGEKHRKRAFEIGVDEYLGKPFQEIQLLSHIRALLKLNVST